jgi:hypothetical protein
MREDMADPKSTVIADEALATAQSAGLTPALPLQPQATPAPPPASIIATNATGMGSVHYGTLMGDERRFAPAPPANDGPNIVASTIQIAQATALQGTTADDSAAANTSLATGDRLATNLESTLQTAQMRGPTRDAESAARATGPDATAAIPNADTPQGAPAAPGAGPRRSPPPRLRMRPPTRPHGS